MVSFSPTLVGRLAESTLLDEALVRCQVGLGSAVFLQGAPGLGTSRLAAETVAAAGRRQLAVLRGRASAVAPGAPYRPVAEALLSWARRSPGFDSAALGPYRAVLGRLVPDWMGAAVEPGPGATREDPSPVLIGEGLLRVCTAAGAGAGCLLVLEDLDQVDAETLGALEYLADNLADAPVVVLVTLRTSTSPAAALARALRGRGTASLVTLAPLTDAEVGELAAAALGTDLAGVPAPVLRALAAIADGNPLAVEELLNQMIEQSRLVDTEDGWQVAEPVDRLLAQTLAAGVAERVDALDPTVREVLSTAAVVGNSFPLALVRGMHDLSERDLLGLLSSVTRLVLPDDQDPDWYRFRHPVFVEVIVAGLGRGAHRDIATRAADVAEGLAGLPELADHWLPLSAGMLARAGDSPRAARYQIDAGHRALAAGAAATAVELFEQASALLDDGPADALAFAAEEGLLTALAETGQVDRAFAVADKLDLSLRDRSWRRRAEIHLELAWAAHVSGRWSDGEAQVRQVRQLLEQARAGAYGEDEAAAEGRIGVRVDTVAAYLNLDSPDARDSSAAEVLARRAVESAAGMLADRRTSALACQAWHLLAVVARDRDLSESDECFERVRRIATDADLPTWQMYGLTGLAGNRWLAEGDIRPLQRAGAAADDRGARFLSLICESIAALGLALTGSGPQADQAAGDLVEESTALKLNSLTRYAHMVRAVVAAQRADRAAMAAALAELQAWGGADTHEMALAIGLGRVFCALLEENRDRAVTELAETSALRSLVRTGFYLAGDSGLSVLLRVVSSGDATTDPERDLAEIDALLDTAPGRMRWNRQFLLWARAVAGGRAGRPEQACADADSAREAGSAFPTAAQLAARLAAECAHADGWGDPVGWLVEAESYFAGNGLATVAGACRALLRDFGAPVQQRRSGVERVPDRLRRSGITVREFEVLELLRQRLSNRAIAERLSISPRTVEKHVASSLAKVGTSDRLAVSEQAWWDAQLDAADPTRR